MVQGFTISYATETRVVYIHEETQRVIYNRFHREAMAFKRLFPQEKYGMWVLLHNQTTTIASGLHQAVPANAGHMFRQDFTVHMDAVLGQIQRLSPVRPVNLAVAQDVLLNIYKEPLPILREILLLSKIIHRNATIYLY